MINSKYMKSNRLSPISQRITKVMVIFLTLAVVVTSVTPVFAQEVPTKTSPPPAPVDSPEVGLKAPVLEEPSIDPDLELPAEEKPQEELPTEEAKSSDEKPLEEKPLEAPEAMAMMSGTQGDGVKFKIPTQPEASVDESTGALIYDYPIALPEGRAGMTPDLSLKYNSRNSSKPDSITGLGWDVSIPYIQRERSSGNVGLYDKASFSASISGNLIATTDTSSSQFTMYRPETDGGEYLKYTYNNDQTWSVTGKDGKTLVFGGTVASRQDNSGNSSQIYKWMLSKVIDSHGNEIQYSYIKDAGQIYPSQIIYTYHASSPAVHTVDFTYTTPANRGSTVYNSAFPVTTYKLLNTIVVTTTIDSLSSYYTYTLNYGDAQFLKQKTLNSITRTNNYYTYGFNQSFDDTTSFSYSTKTPGWEQGTHSLANNLPQIGQNPFKDVRTADFDANGFTDVLVTMRQSSSTYYYLMMNNGTNFVESRSSWSLPNVQLSENAAIVDLNGDSLPDFHPRGYSGSEPHAVYINTGSSFVEDNSETWEVGNYVSEAQGCGPNNGDNKSFDTNTFLHDINLDGKNDILYFGGSLDFRVFLNNGNGFTVSNDYTFDAGSSGSFTTIAPCSGNMDADGYQTLIDINGDGLLDYYHVTHGTYLNTRSGFTYSSTYDMDTDEMDRSGFADINGDGLLDYIGLKWSSGGNSCVRVLFNNGQGFVAINPTDYPTGCTSISSWSPSSLSYYGSNPGMFGTLMDITADGYPDIFGNSTSNGNYGKLRAINNGYNEWAANPNYGDQWVMLSASYLGKFFDANSDGILDYMTYSTNWDGNSSYASKVYMGKQSVPNRLNKITTPLGAQSFVEYTTAKSDASDTEASPVSVVKKVSTQNIGYGQPDMVIQYAYEEGVYNIDAQTGQQRFAGFHKVTQTESGADLNPIRVNETYFHQGNGSNSSTNEPVDDSLALIGKPYYSVVKNPSGSLKKESWSNYGTYTLTAEPVTNRLSQFVYPMESISKTTDSTTNIGTAETYEYDTSIGEQTSKTNLGFVNVAGNGTYTDAAGDSKYEFTEYAANSGNTIIKPKRSDVRTSSLEGGTTNRTDYYYDSQTHGDIGSYGDLTKQSSWVSGNGSVVADSTYTYDSFGNVITETNSRGAITAYAYDSSKSLVVTETNHLNHVTSYEYMTGLLKKITDPNGRVTTHSYSSIGSLYRTTESNTAGSRHMTQWLEQVPTAPYQWVIVSTDLAVVSSSPQYSWQSLDNMGREIRKVVWDRDFDGATNIGWYLKEAKNYDALGRNTTVSAPYGVMTANNDWYGHTNTVVPTNLVTTTAYDIFDRPVAVTNALGTSTNSYAGTEVTTTDANSNQKKTKSDAYGNLIQVKEHSDTNEYTTNYEYDNRNLLSKITDALGNVRNFTYNNAGWVTNSEDLHAPTDIDFGSYSYTYDLNGNQLVETQPNGVTVTHTYDMLDRPTSVDGSSTPGTDYTYTYDSCTNGKGRVCVVNGTLPNSVTLNKTYVYGISGAPTSVAMTTLGNTYTTSYQYTLSDEVKQITHPNGTVVRYTFGEWGLPSKIYTTLPGQSESLYATNTYHHTGKPAAVAINNGPTTAYTYDDAKLYRMTRKWTGTYGTTSTTVNIYPYSGDGDIAHSNSRWSRVWSASSGTTATYNTSNATVGVGLGFSIRRGFIPFDTSSLPDDATITLAKLKLYVNSKLNSDNDGTDWLSISQATQTSTSSLNTSDYNDVGDIGNITQGVDPAERKDITNIATGAYLNFELNAAGKSWINLVGPTKFAILEGHDLTNSPYNGSGSSWNSVNFNTSEAPGTTTDPILEVTYTVPSTTTIQEYNYTYDNVNNITAITEPNLTKSYTYDDLNRLTQAVHTPTPGSATTYNYAYDAVGNITLMNGQAYTYSGTGKTNPHAVTSVGADTYTYDDNGNVATAPNQTFTYNWQNQPTNILVGGSTNVSSAYDESGNRFLYQTPTNTEIQIDDGYLLRNGAPEISLSLGGESVGVISNGTIVNSVTDHLGTAVKQVNASGAVIEDVSYDPYGKVISQTGSLNTKKGYTGHEEDVDTGLVYAQARYYNPSIGRFMGQDAVFKSLGSDQAIKQIAGHDLQIVLADPQILNSHSYTKNNPIAYVDSTGNFPFLLVAAGAIVGATISYFSNPQYTNAPGPGESTVTSVSNYSIMGNGLADTMLGAITGGSLTLEKNVTKLTTRNVQPQLPSPVKQPSLTPSVQQARFLVNAEIDDFGRISRGTVDLKPTLDRVQRGQRLTQYQNDGSVYSNREGLLPAARDPNYYTEHVVPTPGIRNRPGPQRIVTGKGGEVYHTGNHYRSFTKIKGQDN